MSNQLVADSAAHPAHNKHQKQTSMPSAAFELPSSANERPQTYALDGMATGISEHTFRINNLFYEPRFATGWTFRGSNPVGARFSATVQNGSGGHPAPYRMGTGPFPEVNRPERCVDNPHHLVPKLKKAYSYTYTSLVELRGLLYGEIYLYF